MSSFSIDEATRYFNQLLTEQLERTQRIENQSEWVDYSNADSITIGICWGDGIGEEISNHAQSVLEHCLKSAIDSNKIIIKQIKGLTIENRAAKKTAIPDDVLTELKACDVILKGPTTTPQKGDKWPNIESANVAMRRELDLFACVRPINVPRWALTGHFLEKILKAPICLVLEALMLIINLALILK